MENEVIRRYDDARGYISAFRSGNWPETADILPATLTAQIVDILTNFFVSKTVLSYVRGSMAFRERRKLRYEIDNRCNVMAYLLTRKVMSIIKENGLILK